MISISSTIPPVFSGWRENRIAKKAQQDADRAARAHAAQQAAAAQAARDARASALRDLDQWFSKGHRNPLNPKRRPKTIDKQYPAPPNVNPEVHRLLSIQASHSTENGMYRAGSMIHTDYYSGMSLLIRACTAGVQGINYKRFFNSFWGADCTGSFNELKPVPQALVKQGLLHEMPRTELSDYSQPERYQITPKGRQVIYTYLRVICYDPVALGFPEAETSA